MTYRKMLRKVSRYVLLTWWVIFLFIILGCTQEGGKDNRGIQVLSTPTAQAERVTLEGYFSIVYDGPQGQLYFLSVGDQRYELVFKDKNVLRKAGGPMKLRGNKVRVEGWLLSPHRVQVKFIQRLPND